MFNYFEHKLETRFCILSSKVYYYLLFTCTTSIVNLSISNSNGQEKLLGWVLIAVDNISDKGTSRGTARRAQERISRRKYVSAPCYLSLPALNLCVSPVGFSCTVCLRVLAGKKPWGRSQSSPMTFRETRPSLAFSICLLFIIPLCLLNCVYLMC